MRDLRTLENFRRRDKDVLRLWGWFGDATCGAFVLSSPIDGAQLNVIASAEGGWDHVSVSCRNRCPNWTEMDHIKRQFFDDHETVVEFHVPVTDHVNMHPYCLHLWRWQAGEFPRPPAWMVGVGSEPARSIEEAEVRVAGIQTP